MDSRDLRELASSAVSASIFSERLSMLSRRVEMVVSRSRTSSMVGPYLRLRDSTVLTRSSMVAASEGSISSSSA